MIDYKAELICPVTGQLLGWVRDQQVPAIPQMVEVLAGSDVILTTIANRFTTHAPTIPSVPMASGYWAFNVRVPDTFRDGVIRDYSIRSYPPGTEMPASPTPLPAAATVLWSGTLKFLRPVDFEQAPITVPPAGETMPSPIKRKRPHQVHHKPAPPKGGKR